MSKERLRVLDEENTELKLKLKHNKIDLLEEFRKEHPGILYRLTHNTNEKRTLVVPIVVILYASILIFAFAYTGYNFGEPGDANYVLENDVIYDCPDCDWSGNTSLMLWHDGASGVMYYCPDCGHVIGRIPFADKQVI